MDEVKLLPCPLWRNDCEFLLSVIDSCDEAEAPSCEMEPEDVARIDLIRKLLATRPPIGTDEVVERVVREAAEPWADYHGDLPDYDHPLRPVFESGVQYAVELLAKMLHVEDWEICDGTEEFDGDLGGTLLNIVIKTWPADEHGDWIDFRDPKNRIAAMPAIDQDGGVNP